MSQTAETVPQRHYLREKYAGWLVIKPKRLADGDNLIDAHRVTEVMARWLARCVRDQAIVTGVAHLTVHRDFMTNAVTVRAWAYAFQDVRPQDAKALRSLLESPTAQIVRIPDGSLEVRTVVE